LTNAMFGLATAVALAMGAPSSDAVPIIQQFGGIGKLGWLRSPVDSLAICEVWPRLRG
jgi:hypothetical protein